jgi:hypothetical protein
MDEFSNILLLLMLKMYAQSNLLMLRIYFLVFTVDVLVVKRSFICQMDWSWEAMICLRNSFNLEYFIWISTKTVPKICQWGTRKKGKVLFVLNGSTVLCIVPVKNTYYLFTSIHLNITLTYCMKIKMNKLKWQHISISVCHHDTIKYIQRQVKRQTFVYFMQDPPQQSHSH